MYVVPNANLTPLILYRILMKLLRSLSETAPDKESSVQFRESSLGIRLSDLDLPLHVVELLKIHSYVSTYLQ
jgi:hypothetical protein